MNSNVWCSGRTESTASPAREREERRERGDERREVRVREHHALGRAGGAARVDEARDVAGRRRRPPAARARRPPRSTACRSSCARHRVRRRASSRAFTVSSHTTARAPLSARTLRAAPARRAPGRPARPSPPRAGCRSTRSPSRGGSAPRGRRGRPCATPSAREARRDRVGARASRRGSVVRVRPSAVSCCSASARSWRSAISSTSVHERRVRRERLRLLLELRCPSPG